MRWMIVLAWLAPLCAQTGSISAARIREHTRFLAGDLLEGRAPGTRGGALAEAYIAAQFALCGLKPAGVNGSFLQPVPLVGVRTLPTLHLAAGGSNGKLVLRWREDLAGATQTQQPVVALEADVVFGGYGIRAPEYQWDDYRGGAARGKVVVLLSGEPEAGNARLFAGPAATPYSRWNYKFEEALRQGARAVLLIHDAQAAGYDWQVVQNSWTQEEPQFPRPAGAPALAFAGWVHPEAAARMFALSGGSMEDAVRRAATRGFQAAPMGIRIAGRIESALRPIEAHNVMGWIPGDEEGWNNEFVAFSAHWDHLGTDAEAAGDRIFNGAVDNATGVGILLEIARHWASLDRRPRRSALFLSFTGEETALLGSRHYVAQPVRPLDRTILLLNFDAIHPGGLYQQLRLPGADRNGILSLAAEVGERLQLAVIAEGNAGASGDYRSDHVPLAGAGVPAFSIRPGAWRIAPDPDPLRVYAAQRYHKPSDEFDPRWDFAALEQVARFAFALGWEAANGAVASRAAPPAAGRGGKPAPRRPAQ